MIQDISQITGYKRKIIESIICDQKIVDLINEKPNSEIPDTSLYDTNIFDYAFVPGANDKALNYVTVDGQIDNTSKGDTINRYLLCIKIIIHQNNMKISEDSDKSHIHGNRLDELVEKITALLNTKLLGIGSNYLTDISISYPIDNKYVFKTITYDIRDFNKCRFDE